MGCNPTTRQTHEQRVAQFFKLLYRRFAIGGACKPPGRIVTPEDSRVQNPRYSGLQIRATFMRLP
jgi:hypothetical protein